MSPPQEHQKVLGHFNYGTKAHVEQAIDAALLARQRWAALSWEQRAAIFLRAADLLAGPWRMKINAATMLAQSKNAFQAEIDAACELIDFLRFNVAYMQQIYRDQPGSQPGIWNRLEYRPLEGFVFAITPFQFYCYRRKSSGKCCFDGQCRGMETRRKSSLQCLLCHGVVPRSRITGWRHQPDHGRWTRRRRRRFQTPRFCRTCTSPVQRLFSNTCGRRSERTSTSTRHIRE
jgi:hypothetical protein